MAAQDTRNRVVTEAIRLFNAQGSAAVPTNHIAEAAGISPGNLYYHFRNKEEIIRAIFNRVDAHWAASFVLPDDRVPALDDVRVVVRQTFAGIWAYRFFYRELGSLTRRDPELAARFRTLRERGIAGTESLLRAFHGAGVIDGPVDDDDLRRLARLMMLVAEFWLPFEETGSAVPGYEPIDEGVALLMQILDPYLADRALTGMAGARSVMPAREGGER